MTGETSTTTHEQNIALQCPKLTETNYTTWAIMMETILKAYGIWETIVAKEGKAITNEKKENQSKAMIFQTLPQDVLMQVAQYSTTKEVWDSIKVKYLGADLVQKARLQTLSSELETLRMKSNETVSDFGGKLSSIKAKYKGLGGALEDKALVRKLLNSVPKKFLPIVATIEQYQDLDKMSFEEAVGRLIAYEERLKGQDEPETKNEEGLLMAKETNSDNWQGKWHGNRNYGRGRGRNFNKGERSRGRDIHQEERDKKRCYRCNNYGHLGYECTKLKEKDKKEESLLAYYSDEDGKLL